MLYERHGKMTAAVDESPSSDPVSGVESRLHFATEILPFILALVAGGMVAGLLGMFSIFLIVISLQFFLTILI